MRQVQQDSRAQGVDNEAIPYMGQESKLGPGNAGRNTSCSPEVPEAGKMENLQRGPQCHLGVKESWQRR